MTTMEDHILRVTAADGMIRGFFAYTRQTVNEAAQLHKCSPVVAAALGRLLTAAAILGATLKDETDLLTLYIQGDGPMRGAAVTADCQSRVKGFPYERGVILPLKADGKLDVGGAVGKGVLTVTKDIGMKEPYIGKVELVTGEIAEDLASYLKISEQIPSAVSLGVLVDVDYSIKQAGGFIVELMPGCTDAAAARLEQNITSMPYITKLLDDGMTTEDIIKLAFQGFDFEITGKTPVSYYCNCSRDRVLKALMAAGKDELGKMLEEDGGAELHCHFCEKDYYFDENDLISIIRQTT